MVHHPLKGTFDQSQAEWRHVENSSVEVAFTGKLIGMRNSDGPDSPVLVFTQPEWDAFIAGVNDGEFDPESFDDPTDQ